MFNLGIISKPHLSPHTSGSNIFASAPTERSNISTVYVLKKQFTMNSSGAALVGGWLKCSTSSVNSMQVLVNDVEAFVLTSVSSTYEAKFQTISGLNPGDVIKIKIKTSSLFKAAYIKDASIQIAENIALYTAPTVNLD